MRKLTAMIALVAVLFLTTSAFAANPPKPGTEENPGLWEAARWRVPPLSWGSYIVWTLWKFGHFPWQNK